MNNLRNEEYLKAFGTNLRKIRESKNMSQEYLANVSEVSIAQITRIERGIVNTTICTIYALSVGLGVETKRLVDFPMP